MKPILSNAQEYSYQQQDTEELDTPTTIPFQGFIVALMFTIALTVLLTAFMKVLKYIF